MTLQRRLLAVLVTMVALGLAVFAVVSYQIYSRIQYDQLNEQLHSASPLLAQFAGRNYRLGFTQGRLPYGGWVPQSSSRPPAVASAGDDTSNARTGQSYYGGPDNLPEGSYVELRTAQGLVLANSQIKVGCYSSGSQCPSTPHLPTVLKAGPNGTGRMFTDDSDQFRVLVRPLGPPGARSAASGPYRGDLLVTAVPLAGIHRSLHHLVVLFLAVGGAVLATLSVAGLLLLRRGLAPLERIAGTARAIAAGDLSQRAPHADRRTEVGQLGLAFNTMMSRIERAFAERDATEARLRQFLADASHELRTPLTSIRGYAELWKMGAATSGEELRTAMLRIEEHAVEMSALVEELLLLARLDHTRSPERVRLDLTVLAAEAFGDVAVTATDRRFSFDAPEPVTVVGDAHHLRQAITNLLINAVRHTPAGLPVELSLHAEDGVAVLTVADRGPGLSPEGLERAFDRFWRAERSRGTEGSGLGLAIVAAVAVEHGGRASVINAPGGGAAFTVRIPM
ncbi:MAG: HAMP domain-containing histidine kinase, partial [Acidimicrobiaceae bacterium]|nr:HAMP domain-containing histidine kinase [Acidimicrobiaceae bacterium]